MELRCCLRVPANKPAAVTALLPLPLLNEFGRPVNADERRRRHRWNPVVHTSVSLGGRTLPSAAVALTHHHTARFGSTSHRCAGCSCYRSHGRDCTALGAMKLGCRVDRSSHSEMCTCRSFALKITRESNSPVAAVYPVSSACVLVYQHLSSSPRPLTNVCCPNQKPIPSSPPSSSHSTLLTSVCHKRHVNCYNG